jgi:hypothetical protein
MTEARKGNTVKVHYTGKLKDGTVLPFLASVIIICIYMLKPFYFN